VRLSRDLIRLMMTRNSDLIVYIYTDSVYIYSEYTYYYLYYKRVHLLSCPSPDQVIHPLPGPLPTKALQDTQADSTQIKLILDKKSITRYRFSPVSSTAPPRGYLRGP
jgi:hypothetical protein